MLNPVTPEVGEVGVVTVPLPAITVHIPVPIPGTLPASVAVDAQTVWSVPAKEVLGLSSRIMVMSSIEGGQVPLVIVHLKVLMPILKPLTLEVGEPGVVTVAPPVITVQVPVPTIGLFPASVANAEQSVWSGPAADVVGAGSTVTVTVSSEIGQLPLVMVHTKTFGPIPIPVTPEVAELGVVTIPLPAITVQIPVPITGVLPLNDIEEEQMFTSGPAFAGVVVGLT